MTVKWLSAIVAAAASGGFAAVNLVASADVPLALNLALAAIAAVGVVLVVVAELYLRLDARVGVLSDFVVVKLDEISTRLDGLEPPRSLEALLNSADPAVVPLTSRRRS